MVENDFMFEAGNLIGFNNMNPIIILNFPPVLSDDGLLSAA